MIKPHFSATRKGFTLIELLVVIAIIAILAAILFPVFARARENARRSSCQSNLKQIALGVLQYSQDNDEKFPTDNYYGVSVSWAEATGPYVKSLQIFVCPSYSKVVNAASAISPTIGYGNNLHLENLSLAAVKNVSQVVMWYEDSFADNPISAWSTYKKHNDANNFNDAWIDINRHLDGSNLNFVDGHVKWFKLERITGLTQKGITLDPSLDPVT